MQNIQCLAPSNFAKQIYFYYYNFHINKKRGAIRDFGKDKTKLSKNVICQIKAT